MSATLKKLDTIASISALPEATPPKGGPGMIRCVMAALVLGSVGVLPGGCAIVFDAPAQPSSQEVPMGSLEAGFDAVRENAEDAANKKADQAQHWWNKKKDQARVPEKSQKPEKLPVMSFEKSGEYMPQMVINRAVNVVVFIDGKKIEPNSDPELDRIVFIAPGVHELNMTNPDGTVFSASFKIGAGERVFLNGKSATKASRTEDSRNASERVNPNGEVDSRANKAVKTGKEKAVKVGRESAAGAGEHMNLPNKPDISKWKR